MEKPKRTRRPKPDELKLSNPINIRLNKAQMLASKQLSLDRDIDFNKAVRELIDEGIQVVNVRQDGMTVQLCLFTDVQTKRLEKYAKRFGISVNEAINRIVDIKFKDNGKHKLG